MKARIKKQNIKIDWIISAICDEEQRNNPECVIDYRTIGYSKHGKGEIIVVGKVKNQDKIGNLINTFGRMLAEGENFDSEHLHCIDDTDGNTEFTFGVIYGGYDSGEKWIQLLPDFEKDTYENL